jgi:hypothetical protein
MCRTKIKGGYMQPYDKLILERLKGETPREKYEYLIKMQTLLHRIAFPRRGQHEEMWEIMDIVKEIVDNKLINHDDEFVN